MRSLASFESARAELVSAVLADAESRTIAPFPVPQDSAPSTLAELTLALGTMRPWRGRLPIPVSRDYCDRTIWPSPFANMTFRAWHDVVGHYLPRNEMDGPGEVLACEAGIRALWRLSDDARRLMRIEVVGLWRAFDAWGAFPADQLTYVHAAWRNGIRSAIERGAGR